MTALRETVVKIDGLMRNMKTQWVAERDQHETTDLLIYVHVFRDGKMVAALACPLDRDVALQACHLAAIGMVPDVLVTTFESWHSNHPKSPVTNEDWQQGEMAFVGQTMPDALRERWVTECLTTNAYDRFGNYALVSAGYLIEGTKVTFDEAEVYESDDEFKGAGYMHDAFMKMMQMPTLLDQIDEAGGPKAQVVEILTSLMDDTSRLFHMDCAALKALADKELIVSAVLCAEGNPERQEMIADRFGDPDEDQPSDQKD